MKCAQTSPADPGAKRQGFSPARNFAPQRTNQGATPSGSHLPSHPSSHCRLHPSPTCGSALRKRPSGEQVPDATKFCGIFVSNLPTMRGLQQLQRDVGSKPTVFQIFLFWLFFLFAHHPTDQSLCSDTHARKLGCGSVHDNSRGCARPSDLQPHK